MAIPPYQPSLVCANPTGAAPSQAGQALACCFALKADDQHARVKLIVILLQKYASCDKVHHGNPRP